jgi:hypothetical protein
VDARARIVQAAYEVVTGELTNAPTSAGLCLALVRVVIERAFDMRPYGFYAWRTHPVEREDTTVPWARDMERSLARAGMDVITHRYGPAGDPMRYARVEDAHPGELLFRWDAGRTPDGVYVGHVGILLDRGLVLENVDPRYRKSTRGMWRGSNRLTPVGQWPVTSVVAFDPSVAPAA